MSTLRQRQKQKRHQAILDAAAELFSRRGYSAVNVEDIAERAEVGVATIYKYFGAKGGLIRELWRNQMEVLRQAGQRVLDDPPEDPARAMAALIDQYRFGEHWQHRDLFRAISGMNLGYAEIFQGVRDALDEMILGQIEAMIRHFKKRERIPRSLNNRDMSMVLYAVQTFHLQYWAMHDGVSLDHTRRDLRRRVRACFKAWVVA